MERSADFHHGEARGQAVPETTGIVLNWPSWVYDPVARLGMRMMMGVDVRALRRMAVELAQLKPGERVLDVGCGTGSLALEAYKRVGASGYVCGIDPSAPLLAGARRKAARRNVPIDFRPGVIERLTFADRSFDVVLSTIMMHHVPDDLKRRGLAEIARVLKPGGRLLIIDFKRPEEKQGQRVKFGAGMMGIQDVPALVQEAGFLLVESDLTRFRGAGIVLAETRAVEGE